MAGCILVDFENLQVINRSHAYKVSPIMMKMML
jgi:hypothetical protein